MTKKQRKKQIVLDQSIPESVDVTIDDCTLSFTEEECINPANWITFDELVRREELATEASKEHSFDPRLSTEDKLKQMSTIRNHILQTGKKENDTGAA